MRTRKSGAVRGTGVDLPADDGPSLTGRPLLGDSGSDSEQMNFEWNAASRI